MWSATFLRLLRWKGSVSRWYDCGNGMFCVILTEARLALLVWWTDAYQGFSVSPEDIPSADSNTFCLRREAGGILSPTAILNRQTYELLPALSADRSMTLLFDEIERTYTGPAEYGEGSYSFYNRSARPEVDRLRALLQRWLDTYPEEGRQELAGRFRADYRSFDSAFFELYIYALLAALNHKVTLHPIVPGTLRRPDFLAVPEDETSPIYVEAVLAAAEGSEERLANAQQNRIQDDINRFTSPDFFFVIASLAGVSEQHPSRKLLHNFLRATLNGLEPDEVATLIARGEPISSTLRRRFVHKGLELELYPWPKSPEGRGDPSYRPVGAGPVSIIRSQAREAIRDAVKTKASKYGHLEYPYIIAVNATSRWNVEPHEPLDALFGPENAYLSSDGEDVRFVHSGEGAFFHKGRPINTRVSAVLACRDISPAAANRDSLLLIHHPRAARRYMGLLTRLDSLKVDGNNLVKTTGVRPGELLGFPSDWPYEPRMN